MSRVLNYSCSDFQILVGTLDVSGAVIDFSASQSRVQAKEPIVWNGSMKLSGALLPPRQITESLDNFVNPGRWAKAAHPVRVFLFGSKVLTLRIKSYIYDPDAQEADVTLTDLLGLMETGTEKPLTTIEIPSPSVTVSGGRGVARSGSLSWDEVATAIAIEASPTTRGTNIVNRSQVLAPQRTNANFLALPGVSSRPASQLAQISQTSDLSWPWVNSDEQICFARYPNGGFPKIRLSRKQVGDYKRSPPEEPDRNSIELTSSALSSEKEREFDPSYLSQKNFHENENENGENEDSEDNNDSQIFVELSTATQYPIIIESPATGSLISRRTIYQPTTSAGIVQRYETTLARIDSVIPESKSTNFITSEEVWAKEIYESSEGKLIQRIITKSEPLGKIAPDSFPSSTARVVSEESEENWEYDDAGPTLRSRLTKKPVCVVFDDPKLGTGRIPAEREEESWVKLAGSLTGAKYQHQILFYKTRGELYPEEYEGDATLTLDIGRLQPPEITDTKPQPIYREPIEPLVFKISNSPTVKVKNIPAPGLPESEIVDEPLEVNYEYAPDNLEDNIEELANTLLDIAKQRQGNHQISHPVSKTDLESFSPLQIVDICDGRFVRDEFGIYLSVSESGGRELACGYLGLLQGRIPAVQSQVTAISGGETVTLTQSALISPIQVVGAAEVSAISLPQGLSIDQNAIVGSPTASGTAVLEVVNAAGSTQTVTFEVVVALSPSAIALYKKITVRPDIPVTRLGDWFVLPPPTVVQAVSSALRTAQSTVAAAIAAGSERTMGSDRVGVPQLNPSLVELSRQALISASVTNFLRSPIETFRPVEPWFVTPLYGTLGRETAGTWRSISLGTFISRENPGSAYPMRVFPSAPAAERLGQAEIFPVTPQTARGRFYTVTSSNWWASTNYSGLTDRSGSSVAVSNISTSLSFPQWIMADFGSAVVVESVTLGGGSSWSFPSGVPQSIATNLLSCLVQYSNDGSSWIAGFTPENVSDSGNNQFVTFPLRVTARYFRIVTNAVSVCAATSEFSFS